MPLKIVPVITPFKNNVLDMDILREHCERLLNSGIDKVFLAGTNGLGISLDFSEKLKIINELDIDGDKLIIQIGSLNLEKSMELARAARAKGYFAIASVPPYYYSDLDENTIIRYFLDLSRHYKTIVYNYPKMTGHDVNARMLKRIIDSGGDIIGVKDTVNDIMHMLEYKNIEDDLIVLAGPSTHIFSALRSGVDGTVSAAGNYMPNIFRYLSDHVYSNNAFKLQILINSVIDASAHFGIYSANYSLVKIIKKYYCGEPRPPFYPLTESDENNLEKIIKNILKDGDNV
ncbi:dihydrodipicolinate synthase family protein [Picrophilus oshimae]|uniref:2-keto-3-deoxy-phosphogluconate aldolase /2-keto-3-deoxygluconate aldolase /2-keto-3-deoxygalactonate aldolase /2-keto-3-deoxy-phosphogalactonate aldolase n=1 Tax=Picrophilus torridus (strain ATCC 700027 / DSM 9790 / JCM 10055 / NBRC 100828 / KAW 2/3) TaxID=1122961 RepID=A0A8G2FXG5_PICTO|nr:dihydrodipicolinate synthase family protein [Picrophilus oshimae]SMD31238.1 2-keto-3-deoxy-phosphogluconate aldolase /2-keto-3-deoxygluconate aldolase /2-keto-3-deoxygalactonate aldolase /2-keto-3-deoxy-phosphogalactonate aldolase [Picrophilus oshimae DSM 9789]